MKFYAVVLFSLLTILELPFGISQTWKVIEDVDILDEATTEDDDFTETITKGIAQILKNFNSHIPELSSNNIEFNNWFIYDTSLNLEEDDYSVKFSKIFFEQRQNPFARLHNSSRISCEFSKNLKIEMPFGSTGLQLSGDILLHSTTNVSYIVNNSFIVDFSDLLFSMTMKSDLSNKQMLPNNLTEVVISYSNSNISMSTHYQTELITMKVLGSLIQEIKSVLEGQLNTFMQEFSGILFNTCMQPQNEISSINQHFEADEQNYYFGIAPRNFDLGDSITLHMDTIKIKGMQNLKSVDIVQDYFWPLFSLRIENLTGEFGWKYNSNGIDPLEFEPVQFTIDHVTIQGSFRFTGISISDVEIAPVVIFSNLRNTTTTLIEKTLMKRLLNNILISSITDSFKTMTRILS